jgi:hypothetical protein
MTPETCADYPALVAAKVNDLEARLAEAERVIRAAADMEPLGVLVDYIAANMQLDHAAVKP